MTGCCFRNCDHNAAYIWRCGADVRPMCKWHAVEFYRARQDSFAPASLVADIERNIRMLESAGSAGVDRAHLFWERRFDQIVGQVVSPAQPVISAEQKESAIMAFRAATEERCRKWLQR